MIEVDKNFNDTAHAINETAFNSQNPQQLENLKRKNNRVAYKDLKAHELALETRLKT